MTAPPGRFQRLPKVTVTSAHGAPVVTYIKPAPPDAAVQAAYGNGTVNAIVFTDPLVITASPPAKAKSGDSKSANPSVGDGTLTFAPDRITAQPPKPAPPKPAAEVITFEPEVITARAPSVAPTKPPPDPKGKEDEKTVTFAPDTITGRPPGTAPPGVRPPAAKVGKDGMLVFEPDVITARAPGAERQARGEQETESADQTALGPLAPEGKRPRDPHAVGGNQERQPDDAPVKPAVPAGKSEGVGDEGEEPGAAKPTDGKATPKPVADASTISQKGLPTPVVTTQAAVTHGGAGGGGGDTGGGEVSAWQQRVSAATAATPQPSLGNAPVASVTVIHGASQGSAARRKAGAAGLTKDAEKAVRKPPETPKQLPPPPPSPVPEADKLITDASDKKLPEQALPVLKKRTPGEDSTEPVMDTALAADIGSEIAVPKPEPPAAPAADPKKGPDAKRAKKLNDAKKKEPEPGKTAKSGQTMTLKDTAPAPTPGVELGARGQSKEKVAQVLAELLRAPDAEAEKIVTEARKEAYPRNALDEEYPDLGKEKKDEVLAELKAQVESIRLIAGISGQELDAAIKERNETLKKLQGEGQKDIATASDQAKDATKQDGADLADQIAGARAAVDEKTLQTLIAANGEADPQVINLRRDKGLSDLARRAARQDVYYEKSGERRQKALDAASVRMRDAYKNAAKADAKKIYEQVFKDAKKAKKTDDEAKADAVKQSDEQGKPFFEWAATQTLELNKEFGKLRGEAAASTKGFRDAIKQALDQAKEMVRKWATDRIALHETLWDWLIRKFREWRQDAEDDSAAWEAARNEALRDSLVGDLNMIDDIHAAAASGVDMRAYIQERGLDQAQAAVLQTYFGGDPNKPHDAIGAVAVGMRMRIRMTRKPAMIEAFKGEVMAKPDGDWEKLARIAAAEHPPFNVVALASDLFHAMDQWGTDEDKIYAALAHLTPLQAKALRARYQTRYHRSLDEHLESEMSGAELGRAKALLEGNQTVADVETLYEAMHGGLTGWGTDEDAIMQVLRGKSDAERKAIMEEYEKRYGNLKEDLKSELNDWSTGSTHDYDRAMALMDGDTAKADAIAVDQAMHGGWTGLGTDEGQITGVYEQIRREVEGEAAQKGWTTAQMEAEIRRRNQELDDKYEAKYGDPKRDPSDKSKTTLRKAFEDELSDSELDLAVALAENDPLKADAARLEVEKQSFITSDETVNKILASQYERAHKDVERDVNADLQFRAEVAALQDKPWDWKKEREAAKAKIEADTSQRSKQYMSQLENTYDEKYSKFGKGGLQVLIVFNMSGDDQQKAFDLLKQGGKLEPEQEIFYAVNGIGTDVDKLKDVLKGKSPAEVEKIRKAWHDRYHKMGEPDLDDRIAEEVSGRDAKDMEWALKGEPQTMDEKIARAAERKKYEEESYWLGNKFSQNEKAEMQDQYDALVTEKNRLEGMAKLKEPKKPGETDEAYNARLEKYAYWEDSFKLQEGYFDRAIEDHRTAVDSLADTAATIAGIIATVIVIIVVSIFTAGTGGAAILAALASAKVAAATAIAAAAATIATKQLLKGDAYTGQEMAVDVVVGLIDTAASVMTAGVGGALLKTVEKAPASRLAAFIAKTEMATKLTEMAASNRAVTRIFAHGLAEGIEGMAQSLPGALVGNVLDEKNWAKGNPLTNILTGTLTATGMAVAISGGLGGLGGFGKHADQIAEKLPGRKALTEELRETGDVLSRRGSPAERLSLWKTWSAENPGRPYKEFMHEFDAGLVTKEADEAARRALQRDLRKELLAEIPPGERGAFAGVPIEIMSDAEFQQFTKSAKAQAAVIFEDGKPKVILREGADPSVLREEGVHLLQSKDPKLKAKFTELDEARLANWKNLDLEEQLRLYGNKLDIEIDGQQRLLKNIEEQLAGVEDPALREALVARRQAARETLENLRNRVDEVAGLSPLERMKMARGELKAPQFLEQEPRLFTKLGPGPGAAGQLDKELEALAERRLAAREAKEAILNDLNGLSKKGLSAKVQQMTTAFQEIWASYDNRVRGFANRFRELIAEKLDPTTLYDVSKSRLAFLDTIRGMINPAEVDRLDQMLTGVKQLFEIRGLDLAHVDLFTKIAPLLEAPGKLFETVREVVSLNSFRHKRLPDMAGVIETIAKSHDGGRLAAEFGEDLADVAKKTKARDLIDKVKNPTIWAEAQKTLEEAAEKLKEKAPHFHVPEEKLTPILEEFARSGNFNWAVFKEGLAEKFPLSGSTFKEFNAVIEDVKKAIEAGKAPWIAEDVGPLLHWSPVLEKLHGSLGKTEAAELMSRVQAKLKELLPNLTADGYKKYRTFLKNEVVSHIMEGSSPAKQLERLRKFMTVVRDQDSASIGEYFASFRRKIFESGKAPPIKGELAGAFDLPLASRQLEGGKRMVDGALHLPEGFTSEHGPKEGGRFLVEDKAGKSFDLDQAAVYSKALEEGKLKTGDPEVAKGLIYFVEDPLHAAAIANKLDTNKLDSRIFVATFGPDNTLQFVPRTSAPKPKIKPK